MTNLAAQSLIVDDQTEHSVVAALEKTVSSSSLLCPMPGLVPLRVALRVRPAVVQQDGYGVGTRPAPRVCVHLVPGEPQVVVGKELDVASNPTAYANGTTGNSNQHQRKSFTFDSTYGPESTQREIFEGLVAPLMNQFFEGFNATILAYGQTFSGKTFTMGSSNDHKAPDDIRGIIPRVVLDIFEHIKRDADIEYQIRASFVEIYQEQIRDLLMPGNDQRDIAIRENKLGVITISGIHEESVSTPAALMRCLERGGVERTTGDTHIHSYSSRSHAIFTITLEQISRKGLRNRSSTETNTEPLILRRSKLQLVDLAGSERLKRTGAEGVRLRESVKINSGLLALGNVISALGSDKPGKVSDTTHIPYRDSKLTRLLQDSLGGNSRTIMIACVSPLDDDMDETLNTLKYAYRARKIHNKPVVNLVDHQAVEVSNLHQKINQLQGQLQGRSEKQALTTNLSPEMIDFDNEQLMQYFMDELKNRTIRGANATKALKTVNVEKAELEAQLLKSTAELNSVYEEQCIMAMKLQDRDARLSKAKQTITLLESNIQILVSAVQTLLSGVNLHASDEAAVCAILEKYSDSGWNVSSALSDAPSHASFSRSPRQKTLLKLPSISEMNSVVHNTTSTPALGLLGQQLQDAQKKISTLETQLTEAQEAQNSMKNMCAEATHLVQVNSDLKRESLSLQNKNDLLRNELRSLQEHSGGEASIMSIQVLNETGCQTEMPLSSIHHEDGIIEFPVHINPEFSLHMNQENNVEPELETNTRHYTHEFNALMKAKVDLLRELSKANKESEKARHAYHDGIQKLERELETTHREVAKLKNEQLESDQTKERLKEEYERKLKSQETHLLNLKNKVKDLERGIRDKDNSDKRFQESQQEIEKMSIQIAMWKKKLKEESEKFNDSDNRRSKEIAALGKQIEDDNKQIRQLKMQIELGKKKLDRKTEELTTMSRKLKETPHMASIAGSSKMSRVGLFEKGVNSEVGAMTVSFAAAKSVADTESDIKTNDYPAASDAERVKICHNFNKRLGEIRTKLDETEVKIHEGEAALESASAETRDKLFTDLEHLRRNKIVLLKHIVEIRTEKRRIESGMDYDNSHNVLCEDIDVTSDVQDDIDYHELIDRFGNDPFIVDIIPKMRTASLQNCRELVLECLDKIHTMQDLYKITSEGQQLKAQLHASADYTAKLEQKLKRQERVHERQLLAAEAHFQKQLSALDAMTKEEQCLAPKISQVMPIQTREIEVQADFDSSGKHADGSIVRNLEKDVFYYKSANKELKVKLREVVAVNNRLAKSIYKQKEQDLKSEAAVEVSKKQSPCVSSDEQADTSVKNSNIINQAKANAPFAAAVE
ncbi:hypothetical protein RTP6_000158 [Batrachochytrium dendrobatidis]